MVSDNQAIARAAAALEAGRLVAFPTETVYGLGADAENPDAVAAIYALKGRPANHPLIVHVPEGADLSYWALSIPAEAEKLAAVFWPGPLTMILKRAAHVPAFVTGGQDTVGLRCPSHPVAQALLLAFRKGKGGVAAPSANRFGHVSPTLAQHVHDEFGQDARLAAVLDGGQSEVGIESTILDLSRVETHGPVLLRPGKISAADIAAVIGKAPVGADAAAPRASGTLSSHYAPATPVVLATAPEMAVLCARLKEKGRRIAAIYYSPLSADFQSFLFARQVMPDSAPAYSHGFYAAMRAMDGMAADVIIVERPPLGDAWEGIHDRLRRAAHGSSGVMEKLLA
ncbi:MAG: L-threonylcarbamoyladenylate synthase [Alistipes senegalensis]|nr:L-threonylcarbamoyladenylate synthase [Oxalobacter formigenes]MCM1281727.1 L-threonylcarbamoyladenylate synthase [Alistipes senegalensis]